MDSYIKKFNEISKELNRSAAEKLLSMPNVLITPYQAFVTQEALTNIAASTYNIDRWKKNLHSKNELTKATNLAETTALSDYEEL